MSVNKSKPKTTTSSSQTSKPISLQDVEGVSIVGNEGPVTITDSGSIEKAFNFGGDALDFAGDSLGQAAMLTLQLVESQAKAGQEAVAAIKDSADSGFAFAMNAGRSDVATIQGIGKNLIIVVGIVAAAYVAHGWKK